MANLFGDWWGDAVAMFIIFAVYIVFWVFYIKGKESRNKIGLWVAVFIFAISAFSVLGEVFGDYPFSGPQGGFLISFVVMVLSLIGIIVGVLEVFSDEFEDKDKK